METGEKEISSQGAHGRGNRIRWKHDTLLDRPPDYGRDAFHCVPVFARSQGRGGTRPYQVHGPDAPARAVEVPRVLLAARIPC